MYHIASWEGKFHDVNSFFHLIHLFFPGNTFRVQNHPSLSKRALKYYRDSVMRVARLEAAWEREASLVSTVLEWNEKAWGQGRRSR